MATAKKTNHVRNNVDGHPLIDIDYSKGQLALCRNCGEDQFHHGSSPTDTGCNGARVYCKEASVMAKMKKAKPVKPVRKAVRSRVGVRRPVMQGPSGPGARKFKITDDERETLANEVVQQILIYAPLKKEARLSVVGLALVSLSAKVPLSEFLVACERDYLWLASRLKKARAASRHAVAKPRRA